ncbi:dihydrolipoamide acetyltransferase family protein [Nocardioides bizhenqiangii]|uniref:Dihydrolipoamide acetyltransferase component of pyruvate dehydrogenase complex n=1 Tax=Nocardioides bizhenqiangii TaxID=3095076 RepID=A0ABZ0ZUS2_9ACTN|nr:dihydrolipoamide acetyltransferase family protein [Nocardioides sp. HM61]WQQ27569.1 dihydrolipoamide acetyltransferase family protein [Nocardioides sp. HM61]
MTTSTAGAQVFRLPDLGEGLTEAEIVRWLVAVGDQVAVDQAIVEVETAKSLVEVPSPYAGRVATLHGAEGATVPVGSPLITVDAADPTDPPDPVVSTDAATTPAAEAYREEERAGSGNVLIGYGTAEAGGRGRKRRPRPVASAPVKVAAAPSPPPPSPATGPGKPPLVISPLVRRLARDGGVDLADVTPTGEGGVITRSDVVRALADREKPSPATPAATPSGTGERRTPLNGFRKAVAAQLSRSRSEIPEATVWVDVDATALWELREGTRTAADPGPGLLAYLARFVVAGLKQYPVLNARLDVERQEIVEHDHIHLGLAVQSERGLVVPAVLNAETMTTDQLDAAIRALTSRAREGRATAEELAAGTFTLNNYGGFRVDGSAAIINHPQVAILGFGRILDRPWVVDGAIVPRKITQMSFVFDHRVCDGGTAAGFMRVVADAIEDPAAAIRGL